MTMNRKHFTHVAEDVATTTTQIIASNPQRVWCLIQNNSDVPIWIKFGADAVVNEGIRLNAEGGHIEISEETGFMDEREVDAIHNDTGTKRLLITWA